MSGDQQNEWRHQAEEVFSALNGAAEGRLPQEDRALMRSPTEPQVQTLASYALDQVASSRNDGAGTLCEAALASLIAAACAPTGGGCVPIAEDLIRKGISKNELMDHYIPTIARRLGEGWEMDELNFMDVTLGTARIQRLVRHLNDKNTPTPFLAGDRPKILVVVPQDESHTLGALIATAQLRRLGAMVRLLIGQDSEGLVSGIQNDCFDALFVSCSQISNVPKLKKLFDKIRNACDRPPSIVLGGAISSSLGAGCTEIGADLITSDPSEALEHFGLMPTPLSEPLSERMPNDVKTT